MAPDLEDLTLNRAPAANALSARDGTSPTNNGSLLHVRDLVVSYNGKTALGPIDLDVGRGEFLVVVGASGCGKTTLLNCLGGHVAAARGGAWIDGKPVTRPLPIVGTVFQRPNLFPWMTVLDNAAFGLRMRGVARAERHATARQMLGMVGLADVASRRPYELSGGMQQRVALARALAIRPEILLMDEPLGALDAITRERMQREVREIWQRTQTTIVFITHDVDEAMYLGQRVVVVGGEPGRIVDIVDTSAIDAKMSPADGAGEVPALRTHILREITGDRGEPAPAEDEQSASPRRKRKLLESIALTLVAPLAAIGLWFLLVATKAVSPIFLPSPGTVASTGWDIFAHGYRGTPIWQHIWTSLSNVLTAFAFIAVVGIPLGWVMGLSRRAQLVFDPVVEFLRPLPPLAYLTLLVIWLGVGQKTQVTLLMITGFPLMVAAARSAALSVSVELSKTARAFGAGRLQHFRHVVMPASLPEVLTGMRVTVGILFATVIAAEMVAARGGIGWMILDASRFLRSDVIFVGIFLMVLIGFTIDRVFRVIERFAVPWRGQL
jgi:ABC-type nitrate/sulfonate/bicarbonate transport system ATPase subunit/ABC-type nitrate/sulfonate/bicarbonate transport system permease component